MVLYSQVNVFIHLNDYMHSAAARAAIFIFVDRNLLTCSCINILFYCVLQSFFWYRKNSNSKNGVYMSQNGECAWNIKVKHLLFDELDYN
jgi:hypothetical protein